MLAAVAGLPSTLSVDAYCQAVVLLTSLVLQAKVDALLAEAAELRGQTDEREAQHAEWLRRFEEFRAMPTTGVVH